MNGIIRLCCLVVVLFTSLSSVAEQLPVESFSQLPRYEKPVLSPSGTKIAYLRSYKSPEVTVLTSVDLTTGKKLHAVQSDNETNKTNWFEWANDKTLVVSVRFASSINGVDVMETRLLAIDVDGDQPVQRQLSKPPSKHKIGNDHYSQFQDDVISFLPNDPENILIALDLDTVNLPGVYRLNINTGRKSRVSRGKLNIRDWMTDRQGTLRLGEALNYKTGEASIRVRIGDDDTWHKLFEYNSFEESGVTPLGFAKDPNILYYTQYNGDKKALFKIDLATRTSTLVFEDKDYDVDGPLIYSQKTNDVIGLYHSNSNSGRIYWDKSIGNFNKSLAKAFKDYSVYLTDFSADENVYLLYTENDYTPGAYYLGHRKQNSLKLIFEQYPALAPDELSEHKLVSYTARDGSKLEGYLTLPLGAEGPVPTIIHPHGGPHARNYDGFDYWTSFFANRGYAVFRPNFRGSTGYGYEFAQSQMKGWGLTMQDDLTDAANWLVEQNIALKDKMCMVGASYGGYAAAMAAVKTPDLFKCAISFAGVTDLKKRVIRFYDYTGSRRVKEQLGDDFDDLEARSPAYHSGKVKIPMLFIHGEDDRVVDVDQSRVMVKSLKALDKDVDYLELENGDHYLSIQRNRHATFKAMDTFLKQHLN
ncbi:S9 family peptidase [uncultured Paraglaciecola sp.]|uniref:alpha/beta hydrolase family protein n=1 Tax=uncultured Paraglaciecola sp. TaxID=1765024 RepID=UPI0025984F7F|nr:S9 family peptidase [uncultured Paraglaciecola sp.]